MVSDGGNKQVIKTPQISLVSLVSLVSTGLGEIPIVPVAKPPYPQAILTRHQQIFDPLRQSHLLKVHLSGGSDNPHKQGPVGKPTAPQGRLPNDGILNKGGPLGFG